MAMSPRMMLNSCGSSSIFSLRRILPAAKIRGSAAAVIELPGVLRQCMVRSLYIVNNRPPRPTRQAAKNAGPGLESLTAIAAHSSSGEAHSKATQDRIKSNARRGMAHECRKKADRTVTPRILDPLLQSCKYHLDAAEDSSPMQYRCPEVRRYSRPSAAAREARMPSFRRFFETSSKRSAARMTVMSPSSLPK